MMGTRSGDLDPGVLPRLTLGARHGGLSEHLCEGWLEGYLLTGRHGCT